MSDSIDRRRFLKQSLALTGAAAIRALPLSTLAQEGLASMSSVDSRMPVLFVGHGSPMNAIEDNGWSRAFRALGAELPRPKAILAVSAHWFVPGTYLTGERAPKTIHDFGGFPPALYEVQYPAPGAPELAQRVAKLVGEDIASLRTDWGLDHGTWSILRHLFPQADVPVIQLSLNGHLAPAGHLEIGRALAPLRDEGVLVVGSGNLVHNLRDAMGRMGAMSAGGGAGESGGASGPATPDWAARFDSDLRTSLEQRDSEFLVKAPESEDGRRSHPSLDHYLPVLYAVGAAEASDAVSFPIEGFDLGSISMRTVRFG